MRFGHEVYLRGLIEFTNVCKNDCYYCGIRRSNQNAQRYRLREQEILDCCKRAMRWASGRLCSRAARIPGIPTSGCAMVAKIHQNHPDCAITLSIGEKKP